jgi:voltage-gated potassium channel
MVARKKTKGQHNVQKRSLPSLVSPNEPKRRENLREFLRFLYFGESRVATRFRYGLLIFDVVTIAFVIGTTFGGQALWIEWLDPVFGVIILVDFCSRLYASAHPAKEFTYLATWADMVAIVSFLAPVGGAGFAFLRILRTLGLLRSYQVAARLRSDSYFFRRHEEAIIAILRVVVFLFVMTGVVYETQHRQNPAIGNYVDALYFTVTSLTTTGFGDVTLKGTLGRLIAIVIMISGVTLFLRLLQALTRPYKVRYRCPACGLSRHDVDAVHCKACGLLLNIPDEGSD